MLTEMQLQQAIPDALNTVDLTGFGKQISGKVREMVQLDEDRHAIVTTDRVSAFDRVLGLIPYKGQVLNQLSAFWFEQTADIIQNHMIAVPDPNVTIAHTAHPLPVEVIVRGYITGVTSTSMWTLYAAGDRTPYGIPLPDNLQKNDPLPHPVITPTTKATDGGHDERITGTEIIERGLVSPDIWHDVETAAIQLFTRGQQIAHNAGLILVDTKYEFGLYDGQLMLIDEVHTPDSSRYWTRQSYQQGKPDNISKEYLREWFAAQGYRGDGTPPTMPPEFVADVATRYITAYELLTGTPFVPAHQPAAPRIIERLATYKS